MNVYKLTATGIVIRQSDGVSIPADLGNTDYKNYLVDVDAGATIIPADVVSPNVAIIAQIASIEAASMVSRTMREFMMRVNEDFAARDATAQNTVAMILDADVGYQRMKTVNDSVMALRATLV